MKNSILTGVLSLLLLLQAGAAFAQCTEVVWPEGELKAKAEESKVLYEDAIRSGQYKDLRHAVAPFNWMLTTVPKHHISLYIQGADLFDKLATLEKDAAKKQAWIDSLQIVYDLRIQNCGDEANVFNRKALSFIKYSANDKPKESLDILDKAVELNGNETSDGTLLPYMQVIRLNKLKLKNLSDEEILKRYDKITEILDAKISAAKTANKPSDKLETIKTQIDEILMTIVKIDCDFVKKNLEPRYRQNPDDIALAKKIFSYMLQGKCTDDPLWLEVAEKIHATPGEKNCGLAKSLGKIYLAKDNYEKAAVFLKEAQTICTGNTDKAEILMMLGGLEAVQGRKSAARDLYRQAAAADASLQKQVYERIGDLYMTSFDECKQLKSKVDDRAVFLVAYDYYQRAGDTRKMANAKQNFPSKEEIFTEGIDAGTSKAVGCWINESTTIRTRD